ncbi:MAG: TrkA family potassium uptake protein [Negativicutes bacterium]|jgi:trk system potassium uptake protein|nr:TrkA family potassium uptake protein [Negativicutes bacterium]MBP9537066.1 TrkA family potassium uptake protein [Negativicutes bacterium]MBP9949388.1 TrkA family potassium uptake protein [Negativicutes bacterium]
MKKDRQFAVIGLGRFGSNMAKALSKMGYEVLAIDKNQHKVQEFSDEVTHVVQADTTDENALRELGILNFDVVVVAIGEDVQANVLTTLQLKEIGVNFIVATSRNSLHTKLLEKVGADRIVAPERDMARRVAYNLASTSVMDYIELSPRFSIVEITAPKAFQNKTIAESNIRAKYGINVVAIKRGEDLIISPLPSEKIIKDDIVVVVGKNESINGLEALE